MPNYCKFIPSPSKRYTGKKSICCCLIGLILLSAPSIGHCNRPSFIATSSVYAEETGGSQAPLQNGEAQQQTSGEKEQFNRGTFVGKETQERERAAQKIRARNWLIAIATVALGIVTLVLVSKHNHS